MGKATTLPHGIETGMNSTFGVVVGFFGLIN